MKYLALLVVLAVLGQSKLCTINLRKYNETEAAEGDFPGVVNFRIYNGEDADEHEFPGSVYLRINLRNSTGTYEFACGGALISDSWVLTAAHCVLPPNGFTSESIAILAGSSYKTQREAERTVSPENYIPHEEYNASNLSNDIALIELDDPFDISGPHIKPVTLPEQDEDLPSSELTVAGWGMLNNSGVYPNQLQKVEHIQLETKLCNYTTRFCTFPTNETGGLCPGDSGSAAFMDGVEVGIVSATGVQYTNVVGHNTSYVVDIFTRIASYRDWIKNKTDV